MTSHRKGSISNLIIFFCGELVRVRETHNGGARIEMTCLSKIKEKMSQ